MSELYHHDKNSMEIFVYAIIYSLLKMGMKANYSTMIEIDMAMPLYIHLDSIFNAFTTSHSFILIFI